MTADEIELRKTESRKRRQPLFDARDRAKGERKALDMETHELMEKHGLRFFYSFPWHIGRRRGYTIAYSAVRQENVTTCSFAVAECSRKDKFEKFRGRNQAARHFEDDNINFFTFEGKQPPVVAVLSFILDHSK